MFIGIHWQAFLIAAIALAAIPGPGMLYVLARTLQSGSRDGLLSSLGTGLGGLVHVIAAAFGLSVILATSATAFTALKWIGAGYLVFLGIRNLMQARQDGHAMLDTPAANSTRQRTVMHALRDGFLAEALNPKTALFFLALLPQFIVLDAAPLAPRLVLLGTISVTLNTSADFVIVALAAPLGRYLRRHLGCPRRLTQASGLTMIGLGLFLATAKKSS
jgi:threonine/homoserine/homoserine lactone efflux protein